MPFMFEVVLGGVAFSFLSSLAIAARGAQKPQTPYQKWLAEIDKSNVVKRRA